MPAYWLDEVLICPAFGDDREKKERLLAAHKEELACLRFSVILTAKWVKSGVGDTERRNGLRGELVSLRRSYSHKIDQIAMAFSVQDAMEVQHEVEREVAIPASVKPVTIASEYDQLRF